MAMPLSPNTTYVPSSTPSIKAQDLNDCQTFTSGLYAGVYSIAGQVLDGVGGAGPVARAATTALQRAEDGHGHARSLVDYLGYRTGPVIEVCDSLIGLGSTTGATSGPIAGGLLGWSVTGSTHTKTGHYGPTQLAQLHNSWPTGAWVQELTSSRTSSDSIYAFTSPFISGFDDGVAGSPLSSSVAVFEWAVGADNSITSTEWFQGAIFLGTAVSPITTTTLKAGLRWAPSTKGDTSMMLVTCDATTENAVSTGIALLPGTVYRCRLEIHRSGSPLGKRIRLFINGILTTATANLPILASPTNTDMMFEYFTASTATIGSPSGLEIGYFKTFAMPLGSLTAGALTSDV